MKTFEELLNEQILTELGVLSSLGTGISRRVVAAPSAIASKLVGSRSSQGNVNLLKERGQLLDAFKIYCGEQRITSSTVALEDFIEFLKLKVGFTISDGEFGRLAYNKFVPAEKDEDGAIAEAQQDLDAAISARQPTAKPMQTLVDFAKMTDSNGASARKAFWVLARKHHGVSSIFRPVIQYVGRKLSSASLNTLATRVAMIILKNKSNDKGSSSTPEGGQKVNVNSLKVPLAPILDPHAIKNGKWTYDPLTEELAKFGMPVSKFYTFYSNVVSAEKKANPEDAIKELSKTIDNTYGANNCINLTRILLQAFKSPNTPYIDMLAQRYRGGDGEQVFKLQIKNILKLLDRAVEPSEDDAVDLDKYPNGYYDAAAVNKEVYRLVNGEDPSAHMLTLLMVCIATLFGGVDPPKEQ